MKDRTAYYVSRTVLSVHYSIDFGQSCLKSRNSVHSGSRELTTEVSSITLHDTSTMSRGGRLVASSIDYYGIAITLLTEYVGSSALVVRLL